ncbi:uncharacterized protein LOC119983503 [Tripterygium wilfordii]|uniref:uncharacterized protein LOC119983503 n=1 Tax=Tripterygium wilfordii TaxID=458696 RepID=UPI0018F846F6|nr:uncharacterized protein LOC119983503 [Tripterygium wilfordii]
MSNHAAPDPNVDEPEFSDSEVEAENAAGGVIGDDDSSDSEVSEIELGEIGVDDADNVEIHEHYQEDDIADLHRPDYGEDDDYEENGRNRSRVHRGPTYNPKISMKDVKLQVGMQFCSIKQFKRAVRDYAVYGGYQLQFKVHDRMRCHVICIGKNQIGQCKWKCWCSKICGEMTFQIKTLEAKHECGRDFHNCLATAKWLSKKIENKIREDMEIKVTDLIPWIREHVVLDIPYMRAYRAKKLAMERINGNAKVQYARLREYLAEVRKTNVGSTCQVQVNRDANDKPVFWRLYICLDALKRGFLEGCRPFIGLDGCFLKGVYGGQLLTAVAHDGNQGIFPIAWAVVNVENTENWDWFLFRLLQDIGVGPWTFISDQQKGLVHVFEHDLSEYEHRLCSRHLYANFSKKFKGVQLEQQFYKIVKATTVQEFQGEMLNMKTLDTGGWKWLDERADKKWSKAKFNTLSKNDCALNNLCESYNSKILRHRAKPIITLLEELRTESMKRLVKCRLEMDMKQGFLVPIVRDKLEKEREECRMWNATWAGDDNHSLFEVSKQPDKFIVNLKEGSCSCRVWDLTGIPCVHALASINWNGLPVESFVSPYYQRERYLRAYAQIIHPINGPKLWVNTGAEAILPPPPRKARGRPKQKRRREENEPPTNGKIKRTYPIVKCSKCKQVGHNARTCERHQSVAQANAARNRGTINNRGRVRGRGSGRGRGRGRSRSSSIVSDTRVC